MDRLRLWTGQDFLKPRIAPKRVPFPACPQVGKGDAVIGVVDSKRSCEQTLKFRDGSVGFSGAREDQSLKSLRDGALDHVPRDRFQLYCAPTFTKSIFFPSHECIKKSELCVARCVLRAVGDGFFQRWSGSFKVSSRAGGVVTHKIDAALQITFRKRCTRLRRDRVQTAGGERPF